MKPNIIVSSSARILSSVASRMDMYIQIAADSVEQLRKPDVFRVLDECPTKDRRMLADYICDARKDLVDEVADCLDELA